MKIIQLRVVEAGRDEKTYPADAWEKAFKNYALTSIAGKRPVLTVEVDQGEIVVYATGARRGVAARTHYFFAKAKKGRWKCDEKRPVLRRRFNRGINSINRSCDATEIEHGLLRFAMHDRMKTFAISTSDRGSVFQAVSLVWFYKTESQLEVVTQGAVSKVRLKNAL